MLAATEHHFFHLRAVSSSDESPRRGESSGAAKEVTLETAGIILDYISITIIDIKYYDIYSIKLLFAF